MTTLVLLGLTIVGFLVLLDRKDKRHDSHVNRLLHWQYRPETAALEQVSESREGPAFTNEYRAEQDRLLKLVGE